MAEGFSYKAPGNIHLANGWDFVDTLHDNTYDYVDPKNVDLSGRTVFLTGASKGIGRETALSFARAGVSNIAIGARSSLDALEKGLQSAARQAGRQVPQILAFHLDVADYASVERAAAEVEKAFGSLDIMINNAGYCEPFMNILDSKPEEWIRSFQVNVFGTYHVTRAFLPLLLKTPNGMKQIVNLTSIGSALVMPGGSGYNTSKLAISRFTECISAEYPEVLSYSVHPGGVATELASGLPEALLPLLTDKPQLAADTMVWLTAERREWLQGRYISATWDMYELLRKRQEIMSGDLLKAKMRVEYGG
ncbi:hypothetical protein LTR56_022780 [Elasticomyces elasticus]|nr:hypothetical protein LTR22_025398 [Elasticomyces elasticus]KAK3621447.1 hypothetical protein LTR56_022780 [Elasticomyces elasticus]KAK4904734.1 hypothetical protein LTR49_025870 [Elasticomyces elasticus]KAK5741247.1 hypothetical protein LTS12_024678 [Elasticomyces elasticus]